MSRSDTILAKAQDVQASLLNAYATGRTIHCESLGDHVCLVYSEQRHRGASIPHTTTFHGMLPKVRVIVVGLDIREYSRRSPEQQLFLTVTLHATIKRAVELLRNTSLLSRSDSLTLIQTGDGAFVVFNFSECVVDVSAKQDKQMREYIASRGRGEDPEDSPERKAAMATARKISELQRAQNDRHLPEVAGSALSFVLTVNTMLSENNVKQGIVEAHPGRTHTSMFPVECRYALSYDDVLLLHDFNNQRNCVGAGMITCSRILSTDKGNHFLVDEVLKNDLERHGGLARLCGGQWGQQFHCALLDEVGVKSGRFRYVDVFGFYHDGLLLRVLGRTQQSLATYHIGSHNVRAVMQSSA